MRHYPSGAGNKCESHMSKQDRKLNHREELFCTEYIKLDLNATQAAIAAGYSEKTARSMASRLLTKHNISERISQLMSQRSKATQIDAEFVLRRLKEIDELDVIDIIKDDMSGFKLLSEWPKIWRTSISSIDMKRMITSIGENEELETIIEKIKWPDKVKNLEMIGRHVSVKAWDKEDTIVNNTQNIMPVPTADSIDGWEKAAQAQQDNILNGG